MARFSWATDCQYKVHVRYTCPFDGRLDVQPASDMTTLFGNNVHAGLAGLDLADDTIELGQGVTLSKAYAHVMAPFVVAFARPAHAGQHHPGPWLPASGDFSFDVQAQLLIPQALNTATNSSIEVARTILFLLRLGVNPAITLPIFADLPFSQGPQLQSKSMRLFPFEVQPRHLPFGVVGKLATKDEIQWVAQYWQTTLSMIRSNGEFALAVEALDSVQFVHQPALAMVSIWGALEALFSPAKSELRFRVSSLIATFLEEPGADRFNRQQEVAKLYDKRSSAAHGSKETDMKSLVASVNLLQRVLVKIIESGTVPSKTGLEAALFGAPPGP